MAHGNRKRLLIGAAGLTGLVIAALLALPALIDIEAYKPAIVAQAKRAAGRDVVLDGPIRLSLLPSPRVELDGLKIPGLVEARSVTVKPSLLALLIGDIEIAEVVLVEPKITLEIDAAGRPNWEPAPAGATPSAAQPSPPLPRGRLIVENGALSFRDAKAGLTVAAEKASFSASAGSLDGPFSAAGGATVDGAAVTFDVAVGARSAAGHAVDLVLTVAGGRLSFKGTSSELSPAGQLSGKASASADNLVAFAETLIGLTGQPRPHLPPLLAGRFSFYGAVDLSRTSAAAKDFTLVLGEDSGSGSFALTLAPNLAVDARFTAARLDLDRWLAALALPQEVPAPPTTAATSAVAPAAPAPSAASPGWLAALNARLAIEVGEVIYNKKPVRNVALELEARGGAVAVPKFAATLPGDLTVQARSTFSGDPARPTVSGDFNVAGLRLRETLAWLAVDVSSVPENKLTQLNITGRMGSRGGNIQVNEAVFTVDDVKGTGGMVVSFTVPLSIVAQVSLDTLDLDAYLPPAGQGAAPPASRPESTSATPVLAIVGPSIGLTLKVAKIAYRGDSIAGTDLDLERRAGTLTLKDFKVASLAGARIALRGAVARYWAPEAQADFAFDVQIPDMDRVLKLIDSGLIGRPDLANMAGIGALGMRGGIAGSRERLTLRDFTLNALGWAVSASGALALPGAAQGTVKSAAYTGSIVVNGQPIEASIDVDLSGSKPVLAADLRTNALDLGKLRGSASAPRPPRGMPARDAQPIGTPLRGIDGTLKVSAASVGGMAVPVGSTEIDATLKDGVLNVAQFRSGLYGGTLSLSGVIDGSQPSLTFDLKGEATNLNIGDALRRTMGSNEIAGLITIILDGRLNATGLELRGAGTTMAELRAAMAGRASVSGHVQARADKFLQMLGSAATGAVGGIIDATIGNIMSALGDKGGAGAGNLLNAISLVLNRFVNHDNAISGDVEIANGLLTDKSLAVQGNGATARILTRTNLADATTGTTVNFVLAEEPSTPYLVVTARGPLASPAIHAERGAAKDPAGTTGIRPKLPHVTLPNPFGR